ncbi:MAG: M3 family metallopeptidase [Planctomycetota bacterium]
MPTTTSPRLYWSLLGAAAVALATGGCASSADMTQSSTSAPDASGGSSNTSNNPLLADWAGPYGGVPPFDRVRVADFEPALEAAMAEQLEEVAKIAGNPAPPDFTNTIAAMEDTGRTLSRVGTIYGVWGSTMNVDGFQDVELKMAPRLAAFSDQITQNAALFGRIQAVHERAGSLGLSAEERRLVNDYFDDFVRAGGKLDDAAKQRVSAINQELAELYTQFSQNVLADETDKFMVIDNNADLAGLPQSVIDAAAAAAAGKGKDGQWAITNTRSSVDPFLTYSERRALREQAWRMFVSRGDNGDATDNNALIPQILRLRAERAKLLGYPTHAHWRLADTMAKQPEPTMQLMMDVWRPAIARVREEVADMQAIADRDGAGITIAPWDYRHYAEKVRQERYDLDQTEVKQYLQLEKLREGMFWVAGQLFGFRFQPVADGVPVHHPDVRVWEVTAADSGAHVGLWYFDPYAREGKRSGAWMNAYRSQERFRGQITTIVSNNSNFVKGRPGEPVLISWDDAVTLFHEFGHALHGLCSNVTYPTLAGTSVARDYVEFPSQLLEHWLPTPEVLSRFALHYKTGEPLPEALLERIERAATFNQGFSTTEYLASALVDMKLHTLANPEVDPKSFEEATLTELDMPAEIVMRHRPTHFLHIFSSDAYSAGYYSYLWSDTLTADAWEAFTEAGGPYDPNVAARLRQHVFSVGNTVDPGEAYRAFRGRDAQIEPLMRKRGFPLN